MLKEIRFVDKNLTTKKDLKVTPESDVFSVNSPKHLRNDAKVPDKLFPKIEGRGTLLNSFHAAGITRYQSKT